MSGKIQIWMKTGGICVSVFFMIFFAVQAKVNAATISPGETHWYSYDFSDFTAGHKYDGVYWKWPGGSANLELIDGGEFPELSWFGFYVWTDECPPSCGVSFYDWDAEGTWPPDQGPRGPRDGIIGGGFFPESIEHIWLEVARPSGVWRYNIPMMALYEEPWSGSVSTPFVSGTPVPIPSTMLLLGTGLVGLAGFRRKFKKK